MNEADMEVIAGLINRTVMNPKDDKIKSEVREAVAALSSRYPLYGRK